MIKKLILQFIVVLSVCLLSIAYAAAGALVIESEYTFDSVPDGTVVLHEFIIQNNKDIPVKITSVKPG